MARLLSFEYELGHLRSSSFFFSRKTTQKDLNMFSQPRLAYRVGLSCLGSVLLAALVYSGLVSEAQEQPKGSTAQKPLTEPKKAELRAFMRAKLEASNKVLEGLCTEDMALVAEGAKALRKMSDAERWHVTNDVMYKQFSNEFRKITDDLLKAAEEDKPDRATIKWLDVNVSCLDCHRFVRGLRIVDNK